jgi:hypothetical protein
LGPCWIRPGGEPLEGFLPGGEYFCAYAEILADVHGETVSGWCFSDERDFWVHLVLSDVVCYLFGEFISFESGRHSIHGEHVYQDLVYLFFVGLTEHLFEGALTSWNDRVPWAVATSSSPWISISTRSFIGDWRADL